MLKVTDIVFDMDDTLTDTTGYIKDRIYQHYILNNEKDKLKRLKELLKTDISTLHYDVDIRDDIWNYVIKSGEFILNVKPSPFVRSPDFHILLDTISSKGINLHICTHRGFLPSDTGLRFTNYWLEENYLLPFFNNVFVISSKEYPNKLDFLDKKLPKQSYLLFDDNPLHDTNKIHPKNDKLIIYTGVNNLPGYILNTTTDNPITVLKDILIKE